MAKNHVQIFTTPVPIGPGAVIRIRRQAWAESHDPIRQVHLPEPEDVRAVEGVAPILACSICGEEAAQIFNTTGLCAKCRKNALAEATNSIGYTVVTSIGVVAGIASAAAGAPAILVGALGIGALLFAEMLHNNLS